ncbi:MAG TPA: hypothetical protein DCL38_03535 [Lachnospiraceae bacterium]|nr:hypothetical protein [Lachnospiraceae bacterium]
MIYFETGRELDVRLYKTAAMLDDSFRPCGKYILEDDRLIILGGIQSVSLNPLMREASVEAPFKGFDLSGKKARLIKTDSASGRLIKSINDSYREWFEIDPFSNFMEFEGELLETNREVSEYGLTLVWNSQNMMLYQNSAPVTYEQGLQFIIDNDIYEDIGQNLSEWLRDARYYKETGQDDKAVRMYERLIKYIDPSVSIYSETALSLGELYYFNSNYDEALRMYYCCNPEHLRSKRDFYVHIGHALLDRKMKNFESEIKIYYRSLLDPGFYENNHRVVEYASSEIAANYTEYEEVCLRIGKRSYEQGRDRLIGTAGQNGGLVVSDKSEAVEGGVCVPEQKDAVYAPTALPLKPRKRYEDIKLIRKRNIEDIPGESVESLLSKGLSELNSGEYQKAYEIYVRLAEKTGRGSEVYTWAMLQLAKLFSFFDDYEHALSCLTECDRESFGLVYRYEDYMLLYVHARIVLDDFESDRRFRKLIRGRYDHYFARFDREYFFMTRDRNLMDAFSKYERECRENILNQ